LLSALPKLSSERRENKVFISRFKERGTNLFIWTASTRLNYETGAGRQRRGANGLAIDYRQPQAAGTGRATEASAGSRRFYRAESKCS